MWAFTSDVSEFADRVLPLLEQDPMQHTIMLTVTDTLLRDPDALRTEEPWFLGWYDDGAAVRGAVLRTPPFDLLLGVVPPDTVDELVRSLKAGGYAVPGANGDQELVAAFARAWCPDRHEDVQIKMRTRLYVLDELRDPPRMPAGTARLATGDDMDLAIAWYRAFQLEAGGPETEVTPAVRDRIADQRMWLWTDDAGEAVSLAARQRTAAGVARIGPVYTPPEQRRRGYGAAVTAACTRAALDNADGVVLFTDLANPVSNSIYQQIGFRPVSDRVVVGFPAG